MMYVASMLYTEIFHCTSQKDKWILWFIGPADWWLAILLIGG
jgi:hypothetical protein